MSEAIPAIDERVKKFADDVDAAANECWRRLADEFEAIDRKYKLKPYDYSALRTPIAERRKARTVSGVIQHTGIEA